MLVNLVAQTDEDAGGENKNASGGGVEKSPPTKLTINKSVASSASSFDIAALRDQLYTLAACAGDSCREY
jgi:hypothetical protein